MFLLLYCDNYWPMRIDRMWEPVSRRSGAPALTTVYRNADRLHQRSGEGRADGNMEIFDRSRTKPGLKGVEISYAILTRAVLDLLPDEDAALRGGGLPAPVEAGQLRPMSPTIAITASGRWSGCR